MHSKVTQLKASKGSIQIKVSNGRLQLVFSQAGKRHYPSTGLADNKLNRKAAEAKVLLIEADIAYDRFDSTLARYKPQLALSTITSITLMRLLRRKFEPKNRSKKPPTLCQAVQWIAQLGGFLARKSDGEPGFKTLWRGIGVLHHLLEGS